MKQLTIASLLMLSAPVWASTSASIDLWQTDFKNGRLPSGVAATAAGRPAVKDRYKNGWTENGWTVSALGRVYCAVTPTSTMSDIPVENLLDLPAITIPEGYGAILRWSARSLLPQLPESYEIRVRLSGEEDWETLLRIEAEEPQMTTRALSLDAFAGKEIEIRIACTSVDRYMLAIGEIYVGIPSEPEITAANTTPRYFENASPRNIPFAVSGTYFNAGAGVEAGSRIEVRSGEAVLGSLELSAPIPALGEGEFRVEADAPDNATTPYEVLLVTPEGKETRLMSSDVTRSGFARNLVVDEGTGIWCNSCPRGTIELSRLQRQYPGGQVIPVCTHTDDILANDGYWSNLEFYAVPYFMLNRDRTTVGSDTSRFSGALAEPTIASIQVTGLPEFDDYIVRADVEVMFDREIADPERYGVGYVLTSPFNDHRSGRRWMQSNSLTTASSEQYYFLPSVIPASLSFYEHVSVSSDHAFDPVPLLSEESVLAPYTPVRLTLDFGEAFTYPDSGDDDEELIIPEDISLVAYVMERESGKILNATLFPLQQEYFNPARVKAPLSDMQPQMRITDGELLFTLPETGSRYEVTVTDPAGAMVAGYSGAGAGKTRVGLPRHGGIMLVTLTTAQGRRTIKIARPTY